MSETIVIDPRFRGPTESGHGGYVSGVVARLVGSPAAEVTLLKPPPLGKPLDVRRDNGTVGLLHEGVLVAEGGSAAHEIDIPEPVSFADAEAASNSYPGLKTHPFPSCLACGPERTEDDGLRLFAGAVGGRDVVAAPWTPRPWTAGEDGLVRPEFVWTALDCPGGWALMDHAPGRLSLLGRMRGRIDSPVRVGRRYVVVGWPLGAEGRKMYAGTALFDESGALSASALATWIKIGR